MIRTRIVVGSGGTARLNSHRDEIAVDRPVSMVCRGMLALVVPYRTRVGGARVLVAALRGGDGQGRADGQTTRIPGGTLIVRRSNAATAL